jgi:hypothetical protein
MFLDRNINVSLACAGSKNAEFSIYNPFMLTRYPGTGMCFQRKPHMIPEVLGWIYGPSPLVKTGWRSTTLHIHYNFKKYVKDLERFIPREVSGSLITPKHL